MPSPYSGADNFPASYNIPSDGDPRDAASVNVALEALGDRTTYLNNRKGVDFLRTLDYASTDDTAFPPTVQWTSNGLGTFTLVTGLTVVSATVPSPGTTDRLFFDACFTVSTNEGDSVQSGQAHFEWQYKIGSGSYTRVPGTRVHVYAITTGNITRYHVVMMGGHLVTSGAGVYTVSVFGADDAAAAITVIGGINARLWHYGQS